MRGLYKRQVGTWPGPGPSGKRVAAARWPAAKLNRLVSVKASSSRIDWLLFLVLGAMWGSSYLFIKIGVTAGLPPLTLVMGRLFIGGLLLFLVVRLAKEPFPRTLREYAKLSVLGFFGIALPFYLITVAEASTDSALAAVLVSPVPLFVIPMSAIFLHDE